MPQTMLRLKTGTPSGDAPKTTAHLLPCRVHHNGSVEPAQPFWQPSSGPDGTSTAYFRGRKLQGRPVQLPDGYRGVVAAVTSAAEEQEQDQDQEHSRRRRREEEEAGGVEVIDLEAETPTGCVRVQAEFDQMVVWGHEATADAAADPYLRGVEEWLAVAEQIHSYPAPDAQEKKK